MIGAPFLSKMVYKWVKGWTSGRRLPLQIFVLYLPGGGGGGGGLQAKPIIGLNHDFLYPR